MLPTFENLICSIYQIFSRIIWDTLNLDVINALTSYRQGSRCLVRALYKYHNSIATSAIRYCLRMLDGIVLSRVFLGSTDAAMFEDFVL